MLANIVLNELDWWVSNQWYTKKLNGDYCKDWRRIALNKSNLKQVMIVRYADDFKLFCKTHEQAVKIYYATKQWLKERLKLEVSEEKTKIVNLKTEYSEFLGFKLKVYKKGSRWVVKSHICDKSKKKIKANIKSAIKELGKHKDKPSALKLNSVILGIHQYYRIATNVYIDFEKIAYGLTKSLKCRTKTFAGNKGGKSKAFIKFYGGYSGKTIYIKGVAIFPIHYVSTKPPLCFSQDMCNYTPQGRTKIHNNLKKIDKYILIYIMRNPITNASEEFNDNRISLYVAQNGKCAISGKPLQIGDMEVHHKIMKQKGGTDKYQNLIFITKNIHKLVHITDSDKINEYLQNENLNEEQMQKLNELRELVGNCKLV